MNIEQSHLFTVFEMFMVFMFPESFASDTVSNAFERFRASKIVPSQCLLL